VKSVDTNVLARFFVNDPDDAESLLQRAAAVRVMSGAVYVPVTVLLEFEWVLRGFFGLSRAEVARVLRALSELANVTLEDRDCVLSALDWHRDGADLADALHLARSTRRQAFVTFDRRLARRTARLRGAPHVELLR